MTRESTDREVSREPLTQPALKQRSTSTYTSQAVFMCSIVHRGGGDDYARSHCTKVSLRSNIVHKY